MQIQSDSPRELLNLFRAILSHLENVSIHKNHIFMLISEVIV